MVYYHIAADGDASIIRCSSVLNKEMSKLLFNHSLCRLNLNFAKNMSLIRAIDLSPNLADKIQNLSIRVITLYNGALGHPIPQVDLLSKFGGSGIKRKRCIVSFECWPTTSLMVARDVFKHMKAFTGFEEIRITIDLDWMGEAWPASLLDFQVDQIWDRIHEGFGEVEDELAPSLGKGDMGWDEEYQRLMFYPKNAQGEALMEALSL